MHRRVMLNILCLSVLLLPVGVLLAQTPPLGASIHLQGISFDPLAASGHRVPTVADNRDPAASSSMYLVQFTGPVQDAWKVQATQVGARLYGYIQEHAFIARMDATVVDKLQALPFVRWVGPYQPAYRLAPGLARASDLEPVSVSTPLTLTVQTLPDADHDALGVQIERWGGNGHTCLRDGTDACNNAEGVLIAQAPAGTYTVLVRAHQVAQGPQPFAIVASGDHLRLSGTEPPPNLTNKLYLPFVAR